MKWDHLNPNLFLTRAMVKRPAWTRQYGLPLAFRFSIVPHICRLGREPFPLQRDGQAAVTYLRLVIGRERLLKSSAQFLFLRNTVPAELTIYVLLLPGSGLWMPEASKLALLREDIDRNPQRIKAVLRDVGIRREFFNGIPDDDGKAVKAFVSQNRENALKTKPKVSTMFQFLSGLCRSFLRGITSITTLIHPPKSINRVIAVQQPISFLIYPRLCPLYFASLLSRYWKWSSLPALCQFVRAVLHHEDTSNSEALEDIKAFSNFASSGCISC